MIILAAIIVVIIITIIGIFSWFYFSKPDTAALTVVPNSDVAVIVTTKIYYNVKLTPTASTPISATAVNNKVTPTLAFPDRRTQCGIKSSDGYTSISVINIGTKPVSLSGISIFGVTIDKNLKSEYKQYLSNSVGTLTVYDGNKITFGATNSIVFNSFYNIQIDRISILINNEITTTLGLKIMKGEQAMSTNLTNLDALSNIIIDLIDTKNCAS